MGKKNTNRLLIVIALLCAFFFLGCVKEQMIRPKGHEKIILTTAFDTDGDGVADTKFYEFQPITIGEGKGVVFQRMVVVGVEEYRIEIKQLKDISSEQINELENLLFQFEANMTDSERDCREATGLTFGSLSGRCSSIQACFAGCVSPQCAAFSRSSNMVGYWIKDFSDNSYKLKQKLKNIHTLLIALPNDMSLRKDILEDLNDVLNYVNRINSNPIMNPKTLGICHPIPYKVELIGKAMNMLGDYERKPESYRYAVFLKIYTPSETYKQIAVEDQIPQAIKTSILTFTKIEGQYTYSTVTGNISAKQLVLVSGLPEYLAYSIESKCPPREDALEMWLPPATTVKIFDPLQNQYVKIAFEGFKAIYTYFQDLDFYLAFGITSGIIISGIFFTIFTLRLFLALIIPIFKNQSLKESIADWLGAPFLYWKEYVVLLIFLGIITYITDQTLSDQKAISPLSIEAINERFGHWLGIIPTALAAITTTLIYILLENMLKTGLVLVLATPRRMVKENSQKANEIRLKTLKEDVNHLRAIIQKHKKQVDLSEEESLVASIPITRLEEMVAQGRNKEHVRAILEDYMKKVEKALLDAEEKIKIMEKYWENWVSYVKRKIRGRKVIPLSEFTTIPNKWRRWVLWQMIQRNCIVGWNVEGNVLKRIGESKEIMKEETKILEKKDGVLGIMKVENTKVKFALSKKGNSTVMKFLIKRINAYTENILRILKRNNKEFKLRMYGEKMQLIEKKNNERCSVIWGKEGIEKINESED